jgi:hypothetical protein
MTAVPNRPSPGVNRDLPRAPRRARVPPVDYGDRLNRA